MKYIFIMKFFDCLICCKFYHNPVDDEIMSAA